MVTTMTDAEVICTFMERRPEMPPKQYTDKKPLTWWLVHLDRNWTATWHPRSLTLDALHEVETKLIGLGHRDNLDHCLDLEVWRDAVWAAAWHATPEQKIRALASVIRESVTSRLRGMTGDQAEAAGRADWERVTADVHMEPPC